MNIVGRAVASRASPIAGAGAGARARVVLAAVSVVVVVSVAGGCESCLPDYASGAVTCATGTSSCPEGFQCLDPQATGLPTCVRVDCGDGVIARESEQCDDANDNVDDLCLARSPGNIPDPAAGEGVDAADDGVTLCRTAGFCAGAVDGLGVRGDGGTRQGIGRPLLVESDPAGVVYVSAAGTNFIHRIDRRVDASGEQLRITRFAGNGTTISLSAGSADPLPDGISTPLVSSLAADGVGNVFLADLQSNVLRRIDAVTGRVARVAGNGQFAPSVGDVPATESPLKRATSVAVDRDGVVYFVESPNEDGTLRDVRRVSPTTGRIEDVVMNTRPGPDGQTGTYNDDRILGLAFDDNDHLWMARVEGVGAIVDLDLQTRLVTEHSLLPCREAFGLSDVLQENQPNIAVSATGTQVYFASGNRAFRFAPATNECAEIELVAPDADDGCPLQDVSSALLTDFVTVGISDLTLMPLSSSKDGLSYRLLLADAAAGVLRGVDVTEQPTGAVTTTLVPPVGDCFAGDDAALVSQLLLTFTGESDGRIALAETLACCTEPFGACSLPPLTAIARYDTLLPLPASHLVARVSCRQVIETLAGAGRPGFDGDAPRPARNALLDSPVSATETLEGTIFIADAGNRRVRRIQTHAAAPPAPCIEDEPCIDTLLLPCSDPGARADRCVHRPLGLVMDASGQLLVSDAGPSPTEGRILRVDVRNPDAPAVVVVDGLREPTALMFLRYEFVPGLLVGDAAALCEPVVGSRYPSSPCGLLIFAERSGHRIRVRTLAPLGGFELLLAGEPLDVDAPAPGDVDDTDDTTNQGRLRFPRGLMIDAPADIAGAADGTLDEIRLLVVDGVDRFRRLALPVAAFRDLGVLATGVLPTRLTTATALVPPASPDDLPRGFLGRDDAADGTGLLRSPVDIEILDDGRQLLVDRLAGRLRLVDPTTGTLSTVSGMVDGVVPVDAAVAAIDAAPLAAPEGLARDGDVVFAADTEAGRIRRFFLSPSDAPEQWTTDVLPLSTSPGVPRLVAPAGLSVDPETHDLYVVDRARHVVQRIAGATTADAPVEPVIVAGRAGRRGFGGDVTGGPQAGDFVVQDGETYEGRRARLDTLCTPTEPPATEALFNAPEGVLFFRDARGGRWLFVADTGNHRVRRVDLDGGGTITTVLGDGTRASGGTGAGARVPVDSPRGLAVDRSGNLFVTSRDAVRFVGADTFATPCSGSRAGLGVVDAADDAATIYGVDPTRFPDAVTRCLVDVAVRPGSAPGAAELFIVDSCTGMVVRLERSLDTCPAQ